MKIEKGELIKESMFFIAPVLRLPGFMEAFLTKHKTTSPQGPVQIRGAEQVQVNLV
jgi:hypothetical protein